MPVSALSTELMFVADGGAGVVKQRAIAAYLGLAIGDALGATVEFLTPNEIRAGFRQHRDMVGGGWLKLRRGQVTDDTDMSLALGRSILAHGGVDAHAAAEAFSNWMRRKPIDIGNTVRRGLAAYRRTGNPTSPVCDFDAGNGACMRALPIALATLGSSIEEVAAANDAQAHVTHNNPTSDAGTLCVLRMVQTALLGGDRAALAAIAGELVAADRLFDYSRKRSENPSGFIVDTLRTVFQSLFATDNLEAALVDCVNRGGDADTTGAIVGMIAGALYGPAAIPSRWMRHLDRKVRLECIEQAQGLLKLAPLYAGKMPPG